MKFKEAILVFDTILENGPLGTRLKYDYGFEASFDLTEQKEGQEALSELYEGDLAVAQEYHLPIILNAATFRASRNHLQSAGFKKTEDIKRINKGCINFIKAIQLKHSDSTFPIFIGAPLGSMYDAYSTDTIPSVDEAQNYHEEQINIFKGLGVDFINVVTLPSLAEAIGISLSAEQAGIDYTISFILNKDGTLLDGTTLEDAIQAIDARTTQKPLGYLVTCTHASVIEKLAQSPDKYHRLIGIQPNGSSLTPKELATMDKPVADSPEKFTRELIHLKTILGLKIIGGCCGTTRDHLQCLAQSCTPSAPTLRCRL